MKKIFIALIFLPMIGFGQLESNTINDLEIANTLILKNSDSLKSVLDKFEIEYWITKESPTNLTIYISYNNSVRLWEVKIGDIFRSFNGITKVAAKNVVTEIFVRYRHSNINDLRDFFLYEFPPDKESTIYEKSYGDKLSHFRITQL
jgi:hypothetical protein